MVFALTRPRARLWTVALVLLASVVQPQSLLAQYQSTEREFLLLEVRLDQSVLSEAIPAYGLEGDTLLPLGELARLLTLPSKLSPGEPSQAALFSPRTEGSASI